LDLIEDYVFMENRPEGGLPAGDSAAGQSHDADAQATWSLFRTLHDCE